jgi:hypothetical protein
MWPFKKKFNFFESMFKEIRANPDAWKRDESNLLLFKHPKSKLNLTLEDTWYNNQKTNKQEKMGPMFYRWNDKAPPTVYYELSNKEVRKLLNFFQEVEYHRFIAADSE